MGPILSHLILALSAGHRHVTGENHSIQTTIDLWTGVTVEQLRGLHGHVHLDGWHRAGHYKESVYVLGDFSKPYIYQLFSSMTGHF